MPDYAYFPESVFDWDDANINHIAEHNVSPEEVEQVLIGDAWELDFDPDVEGESRWTYVGETSSGRILRIVITERGPMLRVVTAFEPAKQTKLAYLAIKAGEYDRFEGS